MSMATIGVGLAVLAIFDGCCRQSRQGCGPRVRGSAAKNIVSVTVQLSPEGWKKGKKRTEIGLR